MSHDCLNALAMLSMEKKLACLKDRRAKFTYKK